MAVVNCARPFRLVAVPLRVSLSFLGSLIFLGTLTFLEFLFLEGMLQTRLAAAFELSEAFLSSTLFSGPGTLISWLQPPLAPLI